MEERIRAKLKEVRERRFAGKKFDSKTIKAFLQEQVDFLAHTNNEIVPEEQVPHGHLPEIEFPDDSVVEASAGPSAKRPRLA